MNFISTLYAEDILKGCIVGQQDIQPKRNYTAWDAV